MILLFAVAKLHQKSELPNILSGNLRKSYLFVIFLT